MARRIALIEDDRTIASAVSARLRAEGFEVEVAYDGFDGVALFHRFHPDLVVLDLMLPGLDGLEVCRRIQRDGSVPVIMLTARDDETDKIVGLSVGADDYVTKPFSARELVARVNAVLRRAATPPPANVAEVGPVRIDLDRRQVWRGDEAVHLTPTEFELLVMLASRPGAVFSREELLAQVWGYREAWGARTVDSHVRAVRRKLGDDIIRTVHGVGYALGEGS